MLTYHTTDVITQQCEIVKTKDVSTTKIVKLAKHFKTLFKLFSVRGTAYIYL